MARFVRALAVIAIALSPVWGVPSTHAQRASYPTYPAFLANQCNGVSGTNVTIACAQNGFVLTQVLSGYACNELDVDVTDLSEGPFLLTATAQSGSVNNNVSISGPGVYYMRFPFFLTDNLIAIQITATGQGSMTIADIGTAPCPLDTATPTVNPSSTSTNTPVPVTGTPTPIPTFTPLPSGHSTFTPTATPLAATSTSTPDATATPYPGTPPIDCGQASLPLKNCNLYGSDASTTSLTNLDWTWSSTGTCSYTSAATRPTSDGNCQYQGAYQQNSSNNDGHIGTGLAVHQRQNSNSFMSQSVNIPNAGDAHIIYTITGYSGGGPYSLNCRQYVDGTDVGSCNGDFGTVSAGTHTFALMFTSPSNNDFYLLITNAYVGSSSSTDTVTPTGSPTPTTTSVPSTATVTQTPSLTPIPIPGAPETPIPTSTECPGGCAVAAMTQIPGMATVVHVDTSPFDPLKNLSLTRSTCQPFGYVQIPMPVIHGTPALGSTTPLSVTWTTPITGPWDNSIVSGTIVLTNTAVQPCAMSEIPSFVWDLTYWLSVLMCAIAWFLWLIGFVGRLSGEETING